MRKDLLPMNRTTQATVLLGLLLIGAAMLSLCFGATGFQIFDTQLMVNFRLPRTLLAIFSGAVLAASGAALQAMLQNPLAEPYILGISGGAAFGAMLSTFVSTSIFVRSGLAFVGALAAVGIVLSVARRLRSSSAPMALILFGVMLNILFSSIVALFVVLSERSSAHELLFWLMGRLGAWQASEIGVVASVAVLPFALLLVSGHWLDVLMQGDERAASLGINPQRVRGVLIATVAILVASSVALSGLVGFVGLVVPHLLRMTVSGSNKVLVPLSAIGGAVFLLVCDTAARTIAAPVELPVGAISAFVGTPLFIWLLLRGADV